MTVDGVHVDLVDLPMPSFSTTSGLADLGDRLTSLQRRFVLPATGPGVRVDDDFSRAAAAVRAGALGDDVRGAASTWSSVSAGAVDVSLLQALRPPGLSGSTAGFTSPLDLGTTTSDYGYRIHPILGDHRMHHGIDVGAPTGTPIRASAPGRVTYAGDMGSYGRIVIVDHGGGVESRYAHQDRVDVQVGQAVSRGQQLGTVGSTGRSTGPHLHFEIRINGESVDPGRFIPELDHVGHELGRGVHT